MSRARVFLESPEVEKELTVREVFLMWIRDTYRIENTTESSYIDKWLKTVNGIDVTIVLKKDNKDYPIAIVLCPDACCGEMSFRYGNFDGSRKFDVDLTNPQCFVDFDNIAQSIVAERYYYVKGLVKYNRSVMCQFRPDVVKGWKKRAGMTRCGSGGPGVNCKTCDARYCISHRHQAKICCS